MFQLTNDIIILLVILVVVLLYLFSKCKLTCGPGSKEGITYPHPEAGHRPSTGDFLLTTGDVPTEGGYVLESTQIPATISLCRECINHSVNWIVANGLSKDEVSDREWAKNHCKLECRPGSAF